LSFAVIGKRLNIFSLPPVSAQRYNFQLIIPRSKVQALLKPLAPGKTECMFSSVGLKPFLLVTDLVFTAAVSVPQLKGLMLIPALFYKLFSVFLYLAY
jgi:hypothetical protein